jgi:hypothetical protein
VRKKTIEQRRAVCERGLVFAQFFLLNLGKAASDGDFLLLFSKKRRRENDGAQNFSERIEKFYLSKYSGQE